MSIDNTNNSTYCSNIANTVLDKIKEVEDIRTDAELARILGKRSNVISTWRSRNAPDWMLIFEKFNHIPKSVLFGEAESSNISNAESEFCEVPFYASVKASAGTGIIPDEKPPLYLKFRNHYIYKTLRSNPGNLFGMIADGDSMAPAVHHGDMVVIDQSRLHLHESRIYAVRVDDQVYLKLLSHRPGRYITLISINKDYPEYSVSLNDENFQILGTAVNLSRTLIR